MPPKQGVCGTDHLLDIICCISLSLDYVIHLCFLLHLSSLSLMIIALVALPVERGKSMTKEKTQANQTRKTTLWEVSLTLLRKQRSIHMNVTLYLSLWGQRLKTLLFSPCNEFVKWKNSTGTWPLDPLQHAVGHCLVGTFTDMDFSLLMLLLHVFLKHLKVREVVVVGNNRMLLHVTKIKDGNW